MIAFDFRLIYPDGIIYFTFSTTNEVNLPFECLGERASGAVPVSGGRRVLVVVHGWQGTVQDYGSDPQ